MEVYLRYLIDISLLVHCSFRLLYFIKFGQNQSDQNVLPLPNHWKWVGTIKLYEHNRLAGPFTSSDYARLRLVGDKSCE